MHERSMGRSQRPGAAVAWLLGALLLVGGAAAGAARAEEAVAPSEPTRDLELIACAETVARRVQAKYESIRDLKADFEQVTRSVSFGSGALAGAAPTRGNVVFAKPGRMRWTYEEPAPSLMVSDGQTLWLYDPVAQEASRLPVDRGYLSGAALQFLMGEGDVMETFTVVADACDADGSKLVDLELLPRQPATYERMSLQADPRTGLIAQTTIVDLFGNETTIRFSDVRTDTEVSPETFQFSPPEGAQVVDLLAPP